MRMIRLMTKPYKLPVRTTGKFYFPCAMIRDILSVMALVRVFETRAGQIWYEVSRSNFCGAFRYHTRRLVQTFRHANRNI